MEKECLNLNELIYLIRQHDDEAMQLLYQEMRRLAFDVRKKYCAGIITLEDWESEMLTLLEKAVCFYREKSGASFRTVFVRMARNRAIELLRASTRGLGCRSGRLVPFEEVFDGVDVSVEELGRTEPTQSASSRIIAAVACDQICRLLKPYLKERQVQVLQMSRQGYSYDQIARTLQIQKRTVQHALAVASSVYLQIEACIQNGQKPPYSVRTTLPKAKKASGSVQTA